MTPTRETHPHKLIEDQPSLFNSIPSQIIYLNLEGKIARLNKAAAEIYGQPMEMMIGRSIYDLFQPEEADRLFQDHVRVIDSGQAMLGVIEGLTLENGKKHWVLTDKLPNYDLAGQITGVIVLVQDITERIITLEALRQSENRFRTLFEHSPISIWEEDFSEVKSALDQLRTAGVTDFRTYFSTHPEVLADLPSRIKILDVNHTSVDFFGVQDKEQVNRNLSYYFSNDSIEVFREEMIALAEGQTTFSSDIPIRMLDNTPKILSLKLDVVPGFEPDLARVLVSFFDITARRQAEDRYKASQAHLKAIFDLSGIGLTVVDAQGKWLQRNRAFEVLVGYRPDELQNLAFLDLFHADDRISSAQIFSDFRAGKMESCRLEKRFIHKDGSVVWVDLSITPIHDGSGSISAFIGASSDITDRKKAEAEIQRLNKSLEQRVMERTTQLEVANKELEAFSHSISHDLRGPLRHIAGFSHLLVSEYSDVLEDEAKDMLDRMQASAKHLSDLMDALLGLSRLTRAEMHREPVDLSSLAMEITHNLCQNEPDRKVNLQITPGLYGQGDAQLLRLVLENLFNNAWKFTARRRIAQIEFGAQVLPDGSKAFFIHDNGAGFDMAYTKNLFSPFSRLHRQEDFSGTGIGLATVQRIINRHGGRVWAEGAVNKFATFYFTLP